MRQCSHFSQIVEFYDSFENVFAFFRCLRLGKGVLVVCVFPQVHRLLDMETFYSLVCLQFFITCVKCD
jgi:hypothetical protein